MMGIHKEVRKIFGSSVQTYIISARTAQGYEQWKSSTNEERQSILRHWQTMRPNSIDIHGEAQRKSGLDCLDKQPLAPGDFHYLSSDERKRLQDGRQPNIEQKRTFRGHNDKLKRSSYPESHVSHSNIDEDEEALRRAIEASICQDFKSNADDMSDDEHAVALKEAIQRSLSEPQRSSPMIQSNRDSEDSDELKRAIEESLSHHDRQMSAAKTEEEIVIEYVKKQSLAEEDHKLTMHNSTPPRDNK